MIALQLDHFKTDENGIKYAGDHLLIEVKNATNLTDPCYIQDILEDAAIEAGATVIFSYYHPFGVDYGISGVTILSESHISIHTWPEYNYAAIDVFMCGDADPLKTLDIIRKAFYTDDVEYTMIKRGEL